jgi:tetratricopeptide (TPR) repeat protein
MRCRTAAIGALLGGALLVSTARAGAVPRKADVDSLMVVAQAAMGAGRYEAAVHEFNELLARDSNRPEARFQLAVAYRELGRLHAARRHFRLALSSDAGNAKWAARCRTEIGRTWERAGEFREALAEYRLALQADPGYADAEAGRTRLVAVHGD